MARDEFPYFERGATFYNGESIDVNNLGGTEYEGRVYRFEVNSSTGTLNADPSGRVIFCKCVRNRSGANLKPGRVVKFDATDPYGTSIAGYCTAAGDIPAGVVDEYLPPAGVPNNDLFWIVTQGPTKVVQPHTSNSSFAVGDIMIPATTGASATDDLAGRVIKQDLTGATATLANNIQNVVGFAAVANNTVDALFKAFVHMPLRGPY